MQKTLKKQEGMEIKSNGVASNRTLIRHGYKDFQDKQPYIHGDKDHEHQLQSNMSTYS